MLTELTVENYRGFELYRLPELRRVNLLVGRNNCGKTSLLEAVRLFAAHGHPTEFASIAFSRGEVAYVEEDSRNGNGRPYPVLTHFLHGHDSYAGKQFSISAQQGRRLQGGIRSSELIEENPELDELVRQLRMLEYPLSPTVLVTHFEMPDGAYRIYAVPVTASATFRDSPQSVRSRWPTVADDDAEETLPLKWISPEQIDSRGLALMWDETVQEGTESAVIDAMKLLAPRLQSIHFLSSERSYRHAKSGVLLGFKGEKRRVPLGSQGDGMSRMLALSLSLSRTMGGYLLVDEIDTGLHWTVMADMWRLVIETARRNNTQVFATTHSLDCLKGLDQACRDYPHLADDVSAHTIDPTLNESVSMSAKDIRIALEQDIEVR